MTMRRRTAGGLALVLGAAGLVSVWPAQAATWLPGVSVSDETVGDVESVDDLRLVVDADGMATAIWVMEIDGQPDAVQTAARVPGATDYGPVQALGNGGDPDLVAHPNGSVTAVWEADGSLWTTTRPVGVSAFPTASPVSDVPEPERPRAPPDCRRRAQRHDSPHGGAGALVDDT